jgi:hypothetical protein
MAAKKIPDDVKGQVEEIVNRFNQEVIKNPHQFFSVRYRGLYLYLDRKDYGDASPRGRLKYCGNMDDWEFAIYKYSSETYDPEEWFFPGSGYVDGTVLGALKACVEAYP